MVVERGRDGRWKAMVAESQLVVAIHKTKAFMVSSLSFLVGLHLTKVGGENGGRMNKLGRDSSSSGGDLGEVQVD